MLKRIAVLMCVFAIAGCSEPEPQVIDLDKAAADAGLSLEDYEVHENGAIEINSQVENEPIQDKTFGITPDEFGSRLSAEAKEVGLGDIAVDKFSVTEGSVNDVFSEKISDAIAMNGTVDKNGELKSVTFIMGQTENGDTEIMNMMMMAGLSARAISPNQPKEQSAGVLTEVVVDAVKQFGEKGDGEASKIVGDIKYSSLANSQLGIWAVIESV
ncbi:hypothetical protein [Psychrobacter sp. UBA6291]|uniref:hypothetical protein n=1 Tax=Psychrobacter sp. UBA6291 TaxID=1947357 RepID=UPI002579DFCD|nr:hypothetical protein [Psychrobacter sp. UBA6291]